MGRKRVKRNHYNYTLRDGRIIVKQGITNNPDRRFVEMGNAGLQFTSMTLDKTAVSEKDRSQA